MELKKLCELYMNEPTILNKFAIIDNLKDTNLIQRLMIFNLLEKDPFLENWFLSSIKLLVKNPNISISCPEDYQNVFDDEDSVS